MLTGSPRVGPGPAGVTRADAVALSARRERHCVRSPTVIRVTDAPSRTQIDKLGQRLARPSYHATTDDLTLLEQFRAEHSEPLRKASEALRSLGLQPTSRTKTTGTIVDKLRREHPMRLTQTVGSTRVTATEPFTSLPGLLATKSRSRYELAFKTCGPR